MNKISTIILTLLFAIILYSCADNSANNSTQQTPPIPPIDPNIPIEQNKMNLPKNLGLQQRSLYGKKV